jgi:hypothetical protein
MNETFMTEDEENCPVVEYMISNVTNGADEDRIIKKEQWKDIISIHETKGIFRVDDYSKAAQWNIWLSAIGTDGIESGVSKEQNIRLNLFDPPPDKNPIAAEFEFKTDTPTRNPNGTLSIYKYYETYSNLTWFEFPREYTTRRFINYRLPETYDSKGSNVKVKFKKGNDTSLVKYDELKSQITIDKSKFIANPMKIKACKVMNK